MGTMTYKGYIGSVDYSEEDNCLYGKVLGMCKDVITYEGENVNDPDVEPLCSKWKPNCLNNISISPKEKSFGSSLKRLSSLPFLFIIVFSCTKVTIISYKHKLLWLFLMAYYNKE